MTYRELAQCSIVSLGSIVVGKELAEDEVVGAEDLAIGPPADDVHGAGLQVHKHGARHVAAVRLLIVRCWRAPAVDPTFLRTAPSG